MSINIEVSIDNGRICHFNSRELLKDKYAREDTPRGQNGQMANGLKRNGR